MKKISSWSLKKKVLISIIILVGSLFGFSLINWFLAPTPYFTNLKPSSNITVTGSEFTVRGDVSPADSEVKINGNSVSVTNGYFEYRISLKEGDNQIRFEATPKQANKPTIKEFIITRKLTPEEKAAKEAEAKKRVEEEAKRKAEEKAKKETAKKLADTVTVENTIVKKNGSGWTSYYAYWFSIGHNMEKPSGSVKIYLLFSDGELINTGSGNEGIREVNLKDRLAGQYQAKAIGTVYEPKEGQVTKYKYTVTINGFTFEYKARPITDKFSDDSEKFNPEL